MSDLSHKLTDERDLLDAEREERMNRRYIAARVYPVLVGSWIKRDASGWPDYQQAARQAVMATDALIEALRED